MVGAEDILIRIKGKDQSKGAFDSVKQNASGMGNAVSSAVGMIGGMIGYDLVNSLMEAGRGAINASGQLDYFAGRLNMTEQQSENFRNQLDQMQRDFKKVNMTAVGATAEDLASRYQLPIDKLGALTQMTAVMSSEFIRNGRSQEDAVLAVADAMDGQFKRLQEIGITQETLQKNGWNGNLEDQASLIDALNKSMEEMGYDKIAKDITNLDDAWQALTVTGGNLIASVLVPLTPTLIAIADAIINVVNFVQDNGWAQGAVLIGGLAVGFGLLAGALSVAAAAEGGLMALMPGFITSLYGAASGFMAISVAGAPLWAIVAVLAAIALAAYEVGIYFGWWTDVSSMLAAITDGIRRLWEAFINSPQVQGAIRGIQSAFQALWSFLQPLFGWIGDAFANMFGGPGGSPDIVSGIIQAFTQLGNVASQVFTAIQTGWSMMAPVIMPVINMITRVATIFAQLATGQINFQQAVVGVFTAVGTMYQQIGTVLLNLAMTVVTGFVNRIRQIPARIGQIISQAAARLGAVGAMMVARALNLGIRVFNGIVNRIRQIPGRIGSIMGQIPGRIGAIAGAAAGAASNLAMMVLQAVVQGVAGLAMAVYNEFIKIGDKIRESVSSAVQAATSFGNDIKNAVLGALGIASPGIIQRKIAIEFQDIPGRIDENLGGVYRSAQNYASNILSGFNTPSYTPIMRNALNNQYTPENQRNNHGNTYIINEGAIHIDARNKTETEAKQMLVLALEGLRGIDEDIRGI